MKYLLLPLSIFAFASCSVPVSFGLETDVIKTRYSAKGGLVIDIDPSIFVEQSEK